MTTRGRNRLLLATKIVVSVACFIVLTRSIEWGLVASFVRGIDVLWLVIALAVFWLAQVISSLRCAYIARALGGTLDLRTSLRAHFIGLWFNQVLPSSLGGDVVKIAVLQKDLGLNLAIRAAVLDRFSGLAFLMLAIALTLPLYATVLSILPHLASELGALAAAFFGGMLVACWSTRKVPARLLHVPVLRELVQILIDIGSFRTATSLWRQLWTSCVVHCNGIASFALLGVAIGAPVDPLAFTLIVPIVFLITLLPASFAGWGLREISATWLFGAVGIAKEQSLAMSICFGLLLIVAGLPGLILFFRDS
jgi:uncharacterized membrane protein YbhN (UPF0104 family)